MNASKKMAAADRMQQQQQLSIAAQQRVEPNTASATRSDMVRQQQLFKRR